jgi:hypothetical protein
MKIDLSWWIRCKEKNMTMELLFDACVVFPQHNVFVKTLGADKENE